MDEVSKEQNSRYCMPRSRSIKPAGRSPSPPRKWVPTASRQRGVGWRGLPLRTDSRRGQRLPTDTVPSPAPRVSAGLNFVVILLSKTMDVGRDHLIHRKRSPFPYEGKALTPLKVGENFLVGRYTSCIAASEALPYRRCAFPFAKRR